MRRARSARRTGPKWDVVTYTHGDIEYERHAACFIHGITEVENFASIVGSARCELVAAPNVSGRQGVVDA